MRLIAIFLLPLTTFIQAPVVEKVDNAIFFHPLNSEIGFPNTYLLDSVLSAGFSAAIQLLNNWPGQVY